MHLVDIWNVIEAFRENGLNTMEPQNDVSVARLETLVSSLYHNLNKRLTTAQQVPVDSKASLLLNWLIAAYSHDNSGKMRVFSIKVALAIMCAGKLVDKLRCKQLIIYAFYYYGIENQNISYNFSLQTYFRKYQTVLVSWCTVN